MLFSKPQVSFSSDFSSLLSVRKDISTGLLDIKCYIRVTKATNQTGHFKNFKCSCQNSPNSCHFWNNESVFLRNLHQFLVPWDKNLLYFFSCNFIYFQKKEHIKVQIGSNFTWAVESLKICTLTGFFCPNQIKFQLKRYRRVIAPGIEEWCKV